MAERSDKRKAKLAHERDSRQHKAEQGTRFTFNEVVRLVEWPEGQPAAIVDLDGRGTMAIVDRTYVTEDRRTGQPSPAPVACPAVYDAIARQRAIASYEAFSEEGGAET
jgi:hypothetical protein